MYKIVQNIYDNKSLHQLTSSMFVFNLHPTTCSFNKIFLILIG